MELFLALVSGICWTIVYIELIRLGFRDKVCGMPFWALGLNITWEAIYTFIALVSDRTGFLEIQWIITLIWFALDSVILAIYFRYEKRRFPADKMDFVPWIILGIASCFAVQIIFLTTFGIQVGIRYSAFIQNFAMSVMFIYKLYSKTGTRGQSMLAGILKWIGTLAPTIYFGFIEQNNLIIVFGLLCFVYDVIYIGVLCELKKMKLPINHNTMSKTKHFKG